MTDSSTTLITTQKEAAQSLGITADKLRQWSREEWFPENGQTDAGYDVAAIRTARNSVVAAGQTEEVEPVRSPRVRAAVCPTKADHADTMVYKTVGRTRYCKCNDCGATWKQTGPFADPLRNFVDELIESLEATSPVDLPEGGTGIVIPIADRDELVAELRRQLVAK